MCIIKKNDVIPCRLFSRLINDNVTEVVSEAERLIALIYNASFPS